MVFNSLIKMEPVLFRYMRDSEIVLEFYSDDTLNTFEGVSKLLHDREMTLEDFVDQRRKELEEEGIYFYEILGFSERDRVALENAALQIGYCDFKSFFENRLKQLGITKLDLCKRLGIWPSIMYNWFNRQSLGASGKRLERLAEILEVPESSLRVYKRDCPQEIDYEEIRRLPTLGDRLHTIREKKGLTQEEAGEIFGVTGGDISHYERNKNVGFRGITILKFAEGYGVPFDILAPVIESELPKEIGNCIRYRREQLLLNRTILSEMSGVYRGTILKVERGGSYAEDTLIKIVSVLFTGYPDIAQERFGVIIS